MADVTRILTEKGFSRNVASLSELLNTATSGGPIPIAANYSPFQGYADATTITFNFAASNLAQVILGGNRTLAAAGIVTGQFFFVSLTQDGIGSRTVTWFSGIRWPAGSPPTLTTGTNKTDVFGFVALSPTSFLNTDIAQNL
jgi:hypothetical protein